MTKWKPIRAADVPADVVARLESAIPYTHHGHRFCETLVSHNSQQTTWYRLNLATGKYSCTTEKTSWTKTPPAPLTPWRNPL